jgi:hypothetical protein
MAEFFSVIPGRDDVASPESITTVRVMDLGPGPPFGPSPLRKRTMRNDDRGPEMPQNTGDPDLANAGKSG